ncbi:MAG: TIGR01777 family protein [Acidobacteria bacterium]|nr:MAG: TIGR01777 family protein [Acidobacteriota bacterium]
MTMKKVVVAGGTGFLGRSLSTHLTARGYQPVILTRSPKTTNDIREIVWDGLTPGDWVHELEGAVAVVNLAGRSVDCRYHERNRRLIMESRVNSTRVIGEAIAKCKTPPPVWLNASTATIYKHTFGPPWNESGEIRGTSEAKDEFSVEVATAWERTLNEAQTPLTRKVAMRSALVLGAEKNSVFPVLRRLARLGLGGKMGDGRQFVSWIHQTDFCRAVEWLIAKENFNGPVNIAAPHPVTNREMMETFREICGVPVGLPAARWMLEVGAFVLRTETELVIKSRHVTPQRLIESGFAFQFPCLRQALKDLQNDTLGKWNADSK